MAEHIIFEANQAILLRNTRKNRIEQRFKALRQDTIEIMFAISARLDQFGHAQQRQVMTDGRLALSEQIA